MPIPILFQGETMLCIMCGKLEQSDPKVESQWRAITIDKRTFYACPDHFPDDESATVSDFDRAYYDFLKKAIVVMREGDSDAHQF